MDLKAPPLRQLKRKFPLLGASSQCSNFNLKYERLEIKLNQTTNPNVFPTWNRCFITCWKRIDSYLTQYQEKHKSEREAKWAYFASNVVGRINTYSFKNRKEIRVRAIAERINRDSQKLKEEIYYKPNSKETFYRQASKLNRFKGTYTRPNEERGIHDWVYCMGQNCTSFKRLENVMQRKFDPRWNWFITVKCDYFFGDRNPIWEQISHTLIGNFERMSSFQLSGKHDGIYR
ncbi:hypothetical protein JWG44_00075 [Leptospira sp. 201903071]|uniref:hypothetical protein n=1 Tax=Leptospira ainazelensis TaxID=2810034 RepID=UPI0019657076|nr:hypothetical protein [Leptospira ainazelensis]MBM9498650.1 hypothetical protein [Leptospira ainazelensis]